MSNAIFDFLDYRAYLSQILTRPGNRGNRSRLAKSLNCQPAFVSRVLYGHADFSQEHGILINRFFDHNEMEGHFFMLLLHHAKAGTKALREYYLRQIEEIQKKRQMISERIPVKRDLSKEDQMTYYSSWYYSAIHMALLVPELKTKESIARFLSLPASQVGECLDFLISVGLATAEEGGKYKIGERRVHLEKTSPMISKHHSNWRIRALEAVDRRSSENLHYSGPMCISEEAAEKIKAMLLDLIEKSEPIIRDAKEETLFCLGLDFFKF